MNEISIERDCHFELPGSEYDQLHTPNDWIAIIVSCCSENVTKLHSKPCEVDYKKSLIKAGAVIVAAIEHIETMKKIGSFQ